MRGFVPPEPDQGGVSKVQFATVYAPRAKRHRFSANCVQICASREKAIEGSDQHNHLFAARVLGPSKSSEGQYIFYLVEWINL